MSLILDGSKLAWHRDRVEAWLRGERIAPVTVDMALTRACTFNCVYCYGKLQENQIKPLSWPVLARFLDDAAEMGVKAISLVSDGESTCHPSWTDFIVGGKSRGIDMAIGTNGYKMTWRDLETVLPHLTYIRFNISAADTDKYCDIHGVDPHVFIVVKSNIRTAVAIKRAKNLKVTIGLQMVLLPQYADQILPLTALGKELGVDYLVIKHCSDDELGSLHVNYNDYHDLEGVLKQAQAMSTPDYQVAVKWSKIMSGGKRNYSRCLAAPFIMQLSGSGLVTACGMLFNERYKKYHIGNIAETSFKELWKRQQWWWVMDQLRNNFDARTMCGSLCLQHKCNEFLNDLLEVGIHWGVVADMYPEAKPEHVNFI